MDLQRDILPVACRAALRWLFLGNLHEKPRPVFGSSSAGIPPHPGRACWMQRHLRVPRIGSDGSPLSHPVHATRCRTIAAWQFVYAHVQRGLKTLCLE